MKRYILLSLLIYVYSVHGQELSSRVSTFLQSYQLPGNSRVRKASLKSLNVNDSKKTITVTLGNGGDEIHYNEDVVGKIYKDISKLIPDSLRSYELTIIGDGKPIEYLIPTAVKNGKAEKRKIWKRDYEDAPWVTNKSCPYEIKKGLFGRHVSLCQSHGRYYDRGKGGWVWQRPRLFCTTEDLFSQTFVIPYLIPMLENAGAVVYTPRDRFWINDEVVLDNDVFDERSGFFNDISLGDDWEESSSRGFANLKETYEGNESPFGMGTSLEVKSTRREKDIALVQWIPNIPKSGKYPVYVCYQSFKNSSEDVTYEIYHSGGVTSVSVNQKMGGGTWVYLGEYEFEAGMSDKNMIMVSNMSRRRGNMVSVDGVRLGSGMGNIIRGGSISGMPRWAEAAKYSCQWNGLPDSIYSSIESDEYRSDIYSRPKTVNELGGGSVYIPNRSGRNVPFEIYMAFHTDAGYSKTDNLIGPLSICTTSKGDGTMNSGLDRYTSRDLASLMFEGVSRDMKKYGLDCRGLWNRNYGESREGEVPSIIFEMLSHQNFADMRLGYDPQFKFDLCRSFYKSILKYICSMHDVGYVVQPLPVKDFSVDLDESSRKVHLSWNPTSDPLESSANPSSYVVYTRKGRYGFDNGRVVRGIGCDISINPDTIYSFQVCALNDGGKSFPSETLSAYISPANSGTVLIVNGFTRLEGPAWKNTSTEQGFLLDEDPGVQYGKFAGFCGRQKVFSKSNMGSEESNGTGYSGSELEGKIIMGNTFDYPYIHGAGIQISGNHSFTSMSESAFQRMSNLGKYAAIDMIYGVQKAFNRQTVDKLEQYVQNGGKLIISGGNMMKSQIIRGRFGSNNSVQSDSLGASRELYVDNHRFDIYRDMNDESYSVPNPDVVIPTDGSEVLVRYGNGSPAGIRKGNVSLLGFPLESIKDESVRNGLIRMLLNGNFSLPAVVGPAIVEPIVDKSSVNDESLDVSDLSDDSDSHPLESEPQESESRTIIEP